MTISVGKTMMMAAAMLAATPALAADGAAGRMEAYDAAVIGVMKQGLPLAGRADRFETIVTTYYDMPAIAALVAGPAWVGAPAADRTAFTAALARHSAASLARNFKSFGGEKFVVDPAVRPRAGGSVVKVTIDRDVLFFQLRQGPGGWRIVDVISGGVSQLAIQRSELAATITSGGLAAATKKLRDIDAKALAKG